MTPMEIAIQGPPQYDQTTFLGRFQRCMKIMDTLTLFESRASKEAALDLYLRVKKQKEGWKSVDPEAFYRAERLVMCVYHPDNMKPIFWPGRFSAFVPLKVAIYYGMLMPSQQTPVLGFMWQWINQTYNVMLNYCNRNISKETNFFELFQSYTLAVLVSGGIAFAGGKIAPRVSPLVRIFVPFCAVAGANVANLAFVRSSDFLHGVSLRDAETGEPLPGHSKRAGLTGLHQVMFSRINIPLAILVGPPLAMRALFCQRMRFFASRPWLRTPCNVGIITFTLTFPSSAILAVYPQNVILPVSSLEPQFRDLKNRRGNKITHVVFNRGM